MEAGTCDILGHASDCDPLTCPLSEAAPLHVFQFWSVPDFVGRFGRVIGENESDVSFLANCVNIPQLLSHLNQVVRFAAIHAEIGRVDHEHAGLDCI